jgi:hypothetical protein
MNRREFLRIGALATAGIVAEPATAHGSGCRTNPVVSWEWVGGFLLPGVAALRPARLVAYRDGRTVADADRLTRLGSHDLQALRRHMLTVLRDPANTRRRPGAPILADAPETLFMVKAGGGTVYTAQVDALRESPPDDAYPRPLYQLVDHLTTVQHRVLTIGAPYRPNAVRLLTVPDAEPPPTTTPAWPARIPTPPIPAGALYGQLDLRGATAREVARTIPRNDTWQWPSFRTSEGHAVRAAWRYLLPHE